VSDRVCELINRAKAIADNANDKSSIWRAYVAVEYAILDLKLRYRLEGESPPKPPKQPQDLATVRSMLKHIETMSPDKKKLLYDLRACRDQLKALVASYDRRSTMS
jgi:hypothetical protein